MIKIMIRSRDLSFENLVGHIMCHSCDAKILFYSLEHMIPYCPYCSADFQLYEGLVNQEIFDKRKHYFTGI